MGHRTHNTRAEAKPRNLFNPPNDVKGVLGHFNINLLAWLNGKNIYGDYANGWFCHGLTADTLCIKINDARVKLSTAHPGEEMYLFQLDGD